MDILFTLSTSDPKTREAYLYFANNTNSQYFDGIYIHDYYQDLYITVFTMRVVELIRNSISYPRQRTSTDG